MADFGFHNACDFLALRNFIKILKDEALPWGKQFW